MQHQLVTAASYLPIHNPYGYGNSAMLLHLQEIGSKGELLARRQRMIVKLEWWKSIITISPPNADLDIPNMWSAPPWDDARNSNEPSLDFMILVLISSIKVCFNKLYILWNIVNHDIDWAVRMTRQFLQFFGREWGKDYKKLFSFFSWCCFFP